MLVAVERELRDIAEDLLERARRDISVSPPAGDPDEGVSLRKSGRVGPVRRQGERISVAVGFHTPYAAAQHEGRWSYLRNGERVVAVVKQHPGGGSTKFLERNLKEMTPTYEERLTSAVRRAL